MTMQQLDGASTSRAAQLGEIQVADLTPRVFELNLVDLLSSDFGNKLYHRFLELQQDHSDWLPDLCKAAWDLSNRYGQSFSALNPFQRSLFMVLVLSEQLSEVADAVQKYTKLMRQKDTLSSNPFAVLATLEDENVQNNRLGMLNSTELRRDRDQLNSLMTALEYDAAIRHPETSLKLVIASTKSKLFNAGIKQAQQLAWKENSDREMIIRRDQQDQAKDRLQVMKDIAGVVRQNIKAGLGITVLGNGVNVTVESPYHVGLENDIGKYGQEILRAAMGDAKGRQPGERSNVTLEELHSPTLFTQNTAYCGAYILERKECEIYQFMPLGKGFGVLELVAILQNVKRIPEGHLDKKVMDVQRYRVVNGELHMCERKGFFNLMNVQPVQLESGETEVLLTKALQTRGINGGCWNTIVKGQVPQTNPNMEKGFRTASMGVAVAGMAAFFIQKAETPKQARWIDFFEEFKLSDGRPLSLGHCTVGGRVGVCSKELNVVVVAARGGSILKKKVMWGF